MPPIQHLRNSISGKVPLASEVLEGEMVINFADRIIYTLDNNGDIIALGTAVEIVNSLAETVAGKALDATQGKALKDMIDSINTLLSSDDTTLDQLQEIVTFIKANKDDLDNLSIGNIADLQAALDAKEPAFAKNTGFNKNFGTTAGTVAEGNHSHDAGTYTGE